MILLKKSVHNAISYFMPYSLLLPAGADHVLYCDIRNAAYKNAIREQKLALELSAAKRERDFYLSKVDRSRALSSIEERLKKVIGPSLYSSVDVFQ